MKKLFLIILLTSAPLIALAQEGSFVPLTSLPGISDFANSSSLPALLNAIYKIAIGAAAVIAVLQIMRAGILYMGGDSVTEKKQAKDLLGMTIGGLLLVLSPYIVFSIINPKILDLEISSVELDSVSSPSTPSAPKAEGSDPTSPITYHYKTLVGAPATKPTCSKEFKVANFKTLAECTADMTKNTGALTITEDCSGKQVPNSSPDPSNLRSLPRCSP